MNSESSKTSDDTDHYSIFQKNLKKSDKYVTLSNHQKHEKGADNPPIRVFLKKLENRITFTVNEIGWFGWLSVRLRTKWVWVRVQLQSL